MSEIKIWAHRGAGGWDKQYAPENTMPAFQKAVEMGADGIELDVQFSRDGEIVICHDETIERTSDGEGPVRAYTLAELKAFNFCSVHPEFGFVEIPTLQEFLDFMGKHDFQLNIELKTGVYDYPGLEAATAEMVRDYGLADRVLYSSFSIGSLRKLREADRTARIAILCSSDFVLPEDIRALDASHSSLGTDRHSRTRQKMARLGPHCQHMDRGQPRPHETAHSARRRRHHHRLPGHGEKSSRAFVSRYGM